MTCPVPTLRAQRRTPAACQEKNFDGLPLRDESASNLLSIDRVWSLRMAVVENTHFWLLVLAAACLVMIFLPGRSSPETRERRKRPSNLNKTDETAEYADHAKP